MPTGTGMNKGDNAGTDQDAGRGVSALDGQIRQILRRQGSYASQSSSTRVPSQSPVKPGNPAKPGNPGNPSKPMDAQASQIREAELLAYVEGHLAGPAHAAFEQSLLADPQACTTAAVLKAVLDGDSDGDRPEGRSGPEVPRSQSPGAQVQVAAVRKPRWVFLLDKDQKGDAKLTFLRTTVASSSSPNSPQPRPEPNPDQRPTCEPNRGSMFCYWSFGNEVRFTLQPTSPERISLQLEQTNGQGSLQASLGQKGSPLRLRTDAQVLAEVGKGRHEVFVKLSSGEVECLSLELL